MKKSNNLKKEIEKKKKVEEDLKKIRKELSDLDAFIENWKKVIEKQNIEENEKKEK